MPKTRFDTTIHSTEAQARERFEHEGDCLGTVYKHGDEDDILVGYVVLSEEMRVLDFLEEQISEEQGCECYITPEDDWFTGDDE